MSCGLRNYFNIKVLRAGVLIGTVDCDKTVPIREATQRGFGFGHGILNRSSSELLLSIQPDELARRPIDSGSTALIQLHLLHLTNRFLVVQVIIAVHHATVPVAEPIHEHSFFNSAIGAVGTEVVSKAVQTTVEETGFASLWWKLRSQWC